MEELFEKLQEAGKTEEPFASEERLRAVAEELMDNEVVLSDMESK